MARDIYLESRVLAADPVELIHILYEHTVLQVKLARTALRDRNTTGRFQAISKALAGLGELEGALNYKAGGSISLNLGKLYRYARKRVTEGSSKCDDAALAEVESLLSTLNEGWTAMQHQGAFLPAYLPDPHAGAENVAHTWSA